MERRINGHTRLYALIGSPVGHSGSPAMYNYSFEKLGIDAAYLAFDIPLEKTKDAIDAFRTLNVGGFNITMPNKTAAAQLVDRLSPAAELVGACNTVVVEEDKTMTGHITDGIGFVRNLKEQGVGIEGKKIVLLGTGGAATAIAVQAAVLYGIGHSMEAFYYLDTGEIQCLVVPDEFNRGYQSVAELSDSLRRFMKKPERNTVSYSTVRRETLFSKENQEVLFTMSQ